MTESTATMLSKMAGKKNRDKLIAIEHSDNDIFDEPRLTPNSKMEQVLANMIGSSYDHNNTILD